MRIPLPVKAGSLLRLRFMVDKHVAFSRSKLLVIPYTFDGMGSPLAGNPFGYVPISFPGTIQSVTLVADAAPTLFDVDIAMCALADFPSGLTSIVGSSPPTLAGVSKVKDAVLAGWTKYFITDSVFRFTVLDTDTIKVVTIALNVIRF